MALPKIPPLKGKSFFFMTTNKKVGNWVGNLFRTLMGHPKWGMPDVVEELAIMYRREAVKVIGQKSASPPSSDGLRRTLQPYAQNIKGRGWAVGVQAGPMASKYMRHINKAPSQHRKPPPLGSGDRFPGWWQRMGGTTYEIGDGQESTRDKGMWVVSRFNKRRKHFVGFNFAGDGSGPERKVIGSVQKRLNRATIDSLNYSYRITRGGKL